MTPDDLAKYAEDISRYTTQVLASDPTIHPITASVIASDLMSADRITAEVASGLIPADKAVWLVGSYARWGWAMAMIANGALTVEWLRENICHLWSVSDPDDTDPENLRVFASMFGANGGLLRDGRNLPKGGADGYLAIYRGGMPDSVGNGFAWTTDPKVATKFANGAGARVHTPGGVVLRGRVRRSHVLAYITQRHESEVIVDPRFVEVWK